MDANLKPQECKLTSKINEKEVYDFGNIYKVKRNTEYNSKLYKIHLKILETCHRNSFHEVPSSLAFQGKGFTEEILMERALGHLNHQNLIL
jgi:hypothetical protein